MIGMDVFILDETLTLLGVMDRWTSFQGSRSLWEVGKMEAHTTYEDPGAKWLVPGNFLWIDEKRCWMIDYVEKVDDSGRDLIVSGKQAKGLLDQRIVVPDALDDAYHFGWDRFPGPQEPDAPAETIFKHYVNKHASKLAPDPKRRFPNLVTAPDQERGAKTRWSDRFVPLSGMLEDLGIYTGMGWDVLADRETRQFTFEVIPERDQTIGQKDPVVISPDFENVEGLTYKLDTAKSYTVGYLGGHGTDESRLIYALMKPETDTGFRRKETFVSCGSIKNIDNLIFEGEHRMKKLVPAESFEAEAMDSLTFPYMRGWDLGSVVTIRSRALGYDIAQKVTEVEESWDNDGYSCVPIFGMRSATFIDEIHKKEAID